MISFTAEANFKYGYLENSETYTEFIYTENFKKKCK